MTSQEGQGILRLVSLGWGRFIEQKLKLGILSFLIGNLVTPNVELYPGVTLGVSSTLNGEAVDVGSCWLQGTSDHCRFRKCLGFPSQAGAGCGGFLFSSSKEHSGAPPQ